MIPNFIFAVESAGKAEEATGLGALGLNPTAFAIQFITFLIVFLLLKKFAFGPISKLLEERRNVIDDGVRLGLKMEKIKADLDDDVADTLKKARHEADQIIALAHKDAREVIRDAEKSAQKKGNAIIEDAEERAKEEAVRARKHLEKDLVKLVSEATESLVGAKVDSKKDEELVKNALKGQKA